MQAFISMGDVLKGVIGYVTYSQAQIQWSWQYATAFLLICFAWVGLWFGYRKNKLTDHKKRIEKDKKLINERNRLERIKKLYPPKSNE